MKFRTTVDLPINQLAITHAERLLLMGSCFVENIGNLLVSHKFNCDVNPLGILYNPASVSKALWRIISGEPYREDELFHYRGQYHSYMHHGSFSGGEVEETLSSINTRLRQAHERMAQLDYLFLTWGTSWVYYLNSTSEVVANCHKQPDKLFTRKQLTVEEIVNEYHSLIARLQQLNPNLKIILTVSPIRHIKDTLHGNQLSKAVLLLAIEQLRQTCKDRIFYFPSYEIVLDELRDYRFYAEDMVHPSAMAIQYIWECFSKAYFPAETQKVMEEVAKVMKALNHKPFRPDLEEYKRFLEQILLKINRLREKYPNLDVEKEFNLCHILLKQ